MDELIEQITDFKKVLESGIDLNKFLKLISHSTDGEMINMKGEFANILFPEDWERHYQKVSIKVSKEQLLIFFEYLTKHFDKYFRKVQGKYAVRRGVDFKQTEDFKLERIVYYSLYS